MWLYGILAEGKLWQARMAVLPVPSKAEGEGIMDYQNKAEKVQREVLQLMFESIISQPEHQISFSIYQNCSEYQTPANTRAFYEAGLRESILSPDIWELHLKAREN